VINSGIRGKDIFNIIIKNSVMIMVFIAGKYLWKIIMSTFVAKAGPFERVDTTKSIL